MAVDEVLSESAANHSQSTLRFYGWSQPTLSLGYFQPLTQRQQHPASLDCPVVRRTTGGGAIVHDREITYSISTPADDRARGNVAGLYRAMHDMLIATLAGFSIRALLCDASKHPTSSPVPFLCFQRRTDGDVLLEDHKIAGSAQRRHRGAVLQHWSVIFERSDRAPELPGIADLCGWQVDRTAFIEQWLECVHARLGWDLVPSGLSPDEVAAAKRRQVERFGNRGWTSKK